MKAMKITDREGMIHIIVFIVAIIIGILALRMYHSMGLSLVGGEPRFPPALIGGGANSSSRR